MYHALLTNRYLTSRVIPLIAVAAVALCVALVIIVVSVMTGFLNMVKSSGRTLMGDVVISYPVTGIPYYERLIKRIEQLPEAAAATPVVDSWGLLKMPYPEGPNKQTETVQIWGIEPAGFAKVTGEKGYAKTLHWRTIDEEQWQRLFANVISKYWSDVLAAMSDAQRVELVKRAMQSDKPDARDVPNEPAIREWLSRATDDDWLLIFDTARRDKDMLRAALSDEQWNSLLQHDERLARPEQILQDGLTLQRGSPTGGGKPGIVLGMHVSEGNERQRDGSYKAKAFGYWWMPRFEVTLTTLPVSGGGLDEPESVILPVLNEFVSGVYLIDDKRVMVPIEVAQKLMHLDKQDVVDPDDPKKVRGIDPPKATMVLVRAADDVTPERLRDAVQQAYEEFRSDLEADESVLVHPPMLGMGLTVQTWLQQQAAFIGPVEKEREMMRTLFSLVYIVCAGLVLAIFWAIVYEKTRDIGILRSVGASRMGISWIFLRYGLLIGVVGAIAGLGLSVLVVRNINVIHEALGNPPLWLALVVLGLAGLALVVTIIRAIGGRLLPVVLGGLVTLVLATFGLLALWLWSFGGILIWDPAVYYFTKIPNEVDMNSAYITMIGAVIFSLIGAFIPAAKAADTDPVQALRYE